MFLSDSRTVISHYLLKSPPDLCDGARCGHEDTKNLHSNHNHICLRVTVQTIKQPMAEGSPLSDDCANSDASQ